MRGEVGMKRTFAPRWRYDGNHWTAEVWRANSGSFGPHDPYWQTIRTFGWHARFTARRMARKLNRLEQRGMVR